MQNKILGVERKWWTLAVVGSGTLMSALDTSIVNIALPVIGKTTHSRISSIEWVVLIYLITVSSSLLVFGRLADIYGRRFIYMIGLSIFVIGSLFCGLSSRIDFLIASRAIQAIGAAMIFALSPGVLTAAFPSSERGRALGLQATMTYLGVSTGSAAGGFLTQHFGWPSIFFVNIPIGILTLFLSARVLVRDGSSEPQPFDPAGAATMAIALASLLLALSKGLDLGWGSPYIIGLFGVSLICFTLFVMIEKRVEHPVLDFALFRNWTFSASTLAALLCYASTAAITFLMPFYLMHANGYQEARAGLVMMAMPVAMMILTGPSGHLSDKIGARIPATIGMIAMAIGAMLLQGLSAAESPMRVVPIIAFIGIAAGLFTAPNNSAIMGSAPSDRKGVAGAILAAARTTGFATGVALAGLIYQLRLDTLSSLPENLAITAAMHTGMVVTSCLAIMAAMLSALRGT